MFTQEDISAFRRKGISEANAASQLDCFKNGFPYLEIESAAASGNGIMTPSEEDAQMYVRAWGQHASVSEGIVKFVPASGAASRMFKKMFEFVDSDHDEPETDFEKLFFEGLEDFAFRADLDAACLDNTGRSSQALAEAGRYKEVVRQMLSEEGLDYGSLPKGVLKFHKYKDGVRTPLEEHLAEGALYAADMKGNVRIHFTVSPEHLAMFKKLVRVKSSKYEKRYGVKYQIDFSVQKPGTDTIAVDLENNPFRVGGEIVFRPGGHGSLIENLGELGADIVFIKNIDNVVPDSMKQPTVRGKKLLGGILVETRRKIFKFLEELENGAGRSDMNKMLAYLENVLYCRKEGVEAMDDEQLHNYLMTKFDRPLRVCGMVKNVGEPGGGPFLAYNSDGSCSPQILESSQINMDDESSAAMFREGTHFNPVDLVCSLRDKDGNSYDLSKFVDHRTGFISNKSLGGRELKALEHPGLWNGAMSDWNTIFVEVPLSTFNPVKTVNDLLRKQHKE